MNQGSLSLFLTNFGVIEILCSFRLVLEWKTGKEIPASSRLEFLEKSLASNFALSEAEDNNYRQLNRGGVVDSPLLRILLAIYQKSLGSDGFFCFSSKFGSFKNPSAMITTLPELSFKLPPKLLTHHGMK